MTDAEVYKILSASPLEFVRTMWGLVPERDNSKWTKGRHITWQQHDLLLAVESALRKEKSPRISVASGHGTGKDTTLSWLILWYLFTRKDAQIPCTAPTEVQMYDVLWKEIAKWLDLMPSSIRDLYEWSTSYIRIKESPETWFARARTARKEQPEALAGVHGEFVMYCCDEASGIPDEIFNTAEGALTGDNFLLILISNPTRTLGYFHDSHHKDKKNWQTLQFNSEDSPLVSREYVDRVIARFGKDSDEYRIRVQGLFPRADAIDDKGYMPLLLVSDLRTTYDEQLTGKSKRMGIDPSGEGIDTTQWVVRDGFRARIVATEKISSSKSIAQKTLMLMKHYDVPGRNVWVDNFGVGANVAQELAWNGVIVNGVNVGEQCKQDSEKELYLNKRAMAYWELAKWLKSGGELFQHKDWDELLTIRYTRQGKGLIQIMSKKEMRREGYGSPNAADALALTFLENATLPAYQEVSSEEPFDRFALL